MSCNVTYQKTTAVPSRGACGNFDIFIGRLPRYPALIEPCFLRLQTVLGQSGVARTSEDNKIELQHNGLTINY